MVRMVRSRKEYRCSACSAKAIKWSGYCAKCKAAGTMKEFQLLPEKPKSRETAPQKAIRRRWKTRERDAVRSMTTVDGHDPAFKNVTSSTGKVGHITGMQIDGISRNYVIEVKNRTLPIWINKAWIQILQKAHDFNKHALLHIEPSNITREYPVNGIKRRTDNMAVITQTRHESLILSEKTLLAAREILSSDVSNLIKVRQLKDIIGE